jgi:hypothetical protein
MNQGYSTGRINALLGGAVLVVGGIVLLLKNMGAISFTNWWAVFILAPAIASLLIAWRTYQGAGGRLTGAIRGPLMSGLSLLIVALVFILGLNWSNIWPVFLILSGVGSLLFAGMRDR